MCLEIIHLKETESLHHILQNLSSIELQTAKITLTVQDSSKQLHICTESRDVCFQLETENHSTYCAVADISESSGQFVGLISQRLRTRANEESFKHARDCLVKDVEQSRQQKLQILSYQMEAASQLKSERSANCKRALKRETKQRKPSPKRANTGTKDLPNLISGRGKPRVSHVAHAAATTRANQSARGTDVVTLSARSTTEANQSGYLNATAVNSTSQLRLYCDAKCCEASARRRALELRLEKAQSECDCSVRESLIEAIRRDLHSLVDELRNDRQLVQAYPISGIS